MALTNTQQDEQKMTGIRTRPWILVLGLVGVVLVLFLFLWRLDSYPAPWFDEGAYMNVAKTLVQDGVYAEKSSDGYRFNGAVISTGPTVILPMAAMYKVFGVSIVAGRLVVVGYGLLTLAMTYLLAMRLLPDWRFALTAVVLALLAWGNWMPLVFRTVMGEGPGAFFVLAALWTWFTPNRPGLLRLAAVGMLLGLATMTKVQYALIVFPALGFAFLLDLLWYKRAGWRFFVVPGGVAALLCGLWLLAAYVLLGQEFRNQGADIATSSATATISYFTINLSAIATNLLSLTFGQAYGGLYIVGLITAAALGAPRSANGQRWSILTVLMLTSTAFYLIMAGVAPEHNRLAVPMYLLGSFAVARLLYALMNRIEVKWGELPDAIRRGELPQQALGPIIVVGFAFTLVLLPLLRAAYNVTSSGSSAPYAAARYLDQNADPNDLIETWDREMGILTGHNYHFPPQVVQAYHNAHIANPALPAAGELYDVFEHVTPDYIVIGPMSRWAALYPPGVLASYDLVFETGQTGNHYEIYAHR